MQAHRGDPDWDSYYEVTIKVTVKAKDYKAAKGCYLSVVCGNQKEGRNWALVKKDPPKVLIVPKESDPQIRVTKKEVT
jgi:hypothetical protein